ncbi:MAG TPA: TadE/TadG family type IV pilus assembly protein [Bacillota bacterium]|nr:TadE/TadG family type IV pilus assembly protein [Bacillota bacterium]
MMHYLLTCLKKIKSEPKGQALAEFALVSLPLVLLLLGIIEFGWLFHAQMTVISAAREGARAAAAGEDCLSAVQNYMQATPVALAEVNVRPGGGENNPWSMVEVTGQIKPLVGLFIKGNTINLSAQAAMRTGLKQKGEI